jgi:hypothetical protein
MEADMKSFAEVFNGTLYGVMSWEKWDELRSRILADGKAWYVYAVGHGVPDAPFQGTAFAHALDEIHEVLKREHEEEHMGIIYADSFADPCLVKIYDPNNLGSSCGSCGRVIPPGWVLSLQPPMPIASDMPLPNNRRRWWQALLDRIESH